MINKVPDNLCTGCGICATVCPKKAVRMTKNKDGFRIPEVDKTTCINCDICEKHCHILSLAKKSILEPLTYCAYAKDDIIREKSSSGGVFYYLAQNVIGLGGTVYGSILDNDLIVRHVRAETVDDCIPMMGSKYVQSIIDSNVYENIKRDLSQNKPVLFSGTPCQCAAVRRYINKNDINLITVSFICHGVPSPKVWEKYIEFKEKNNGKILNASFRNKSYGWERFSLLLQFESGRTEINPLDKDLFMQAFLKNNCLRESCYDCKYKGNESYQDIDIMLADWWGAEDIEIFKKSEDKGISAVYIYTSRGNQIWSEVKNYFEFSRIDFQKTSRSNVAFYSSAIKGIHQKEFMNSLDFLPFDRLVKKYCYTPLHVRIKRKVIPVVYIIAKRTGLLNLYKKLR